MKRLFLALLLVVASSGAVCAQDIYEEVSNLKDQYQRDKDNPSKSLADRKIATFKYDATWYLLEHAGNNTEYQLGSQVAAMSDYVFFFLSEMKAAKSDQKKKTVITKFKNASLAHPLFHDDDKEITYAYIDNDNFLTQFCLDTDWVEALADVRQR